MRAANLAGSAAAEPHSVPALRLPYGGVQAPPEAEAAGEAEAGDRPLDEEAIDCCGRLSGRARARERERERAASLPYPLLDS